MINQRFFHKLEDQILRWPRAAREYAENETQYQKKKRAEAEKKIQDSKEYAI